MAISNKPLRLDLQFFAENNLTVTGDLARVQSIDFVNRFEGNLSKLVEALGITRKLPLSEGMTIKTYTSSVILANGNVPEGDVIPLSKVTTVPGPSYEVALKKYRKAVSAEAIQRHGFDQAVNETDEKMLREIQKGIRSDFFAFLGTGTGLATATDLQGAFSQAWGRVQTLFEDDSVQTIVFINPMDVADYLGKANVTTQTVFGMTFITGFTGVIAITNTSVPAGTVYATAPENIVLAYIPVSASEMAKAFSFTTDQTGYIGVTHDKHTDTLTYDTVAVDGIFLFAERLDGVVKITVSEAPAV